MKYKKYFPILTIISLSSCIWFFELHNYLNFEKLKNHYSSLESFVSENFFLSILCYCIFYIIIVSLSIPGASFMTITGGLLFGQWIGTFFVVLSATIGATILFISAKMISSDTLLEKGGKWVKRMQNGFQNNALSYLLTLRLIPIFPFALVNLVAAILQIPLKTFFIATFFGIIPGSFVYVSIGVAFTEIINQANFSAEIIIKEEIIIALVGLGILALAPTIYKLFSKS